MNKSRTEQKTEVSKFCQIIFGLVLTLTENFGSKLNFAILYGLHFSTKYPRPFSLSGIILIQSH